MATLVGFYVVSRPFLNKNSTRHASSTHSEKMEVNMYTIDFWLYKHGTGLKDTPLT